MGRAYAKRYGFEFICLRYVGGLYGPSPTALKATREIAIQQMIRAAVKGEAARIPWPYAPTEVLYGKDAAKGTVLAILKDNFKDQLFHIGNGQLVGGEEIVAAIKKGFPGSDIELVKGGNPCPIRNRGWPAISRSRRNSSVMSQITRWRKPSGLCRDVEKVGKALGGCITIRLKYYPTIHV